MKRIESRRIATANTAALRPAAGRGHCLGARATGGSGIASLDWSASTWLIRAPHSSARLTLVEDEAPADPHLDQRDHHDHDEQEPGERRRVAEVEELERLAEEVDRVEERRLRLVRLRSGPVERRVRLRELGQAGDRE